MSIVFKICPATEWALAAGGKNVPASADDKRDGFIHLSTAQQLAGTIARHFANRDDLILVAIAAETLGASLRWERSRDGALFPHCYGPIPMVSVQWARPLDGARPDKTIGVP